MRQPKKKPSVGGHRSPEARQTLGGCEPVEQGKRRRGNGAPQAHDAGELGPQRSRRTVRRASVKGAVEAAARLTKRPAGQDRQNQEKPRRGDGATTPTPLSKNKSWAVDLLAVAPWRIANLSG